MKKNIKFSKRTLAMLLTLMMVSSIFVLPSGAAEEDDIISLQLSAGGYEIIQDDRGLHHITMLSEGYGVLDSPGDPSLPEKIVEVQVPQNIIWSSVKITYEIVSSEVLPGSYNISPCPPDIAVIGGNTTEENIEIVRWGEGKAIVNGTNWYVYGQDAFYPEYPVELIPYTERKIRSNLAANYIAKYIRLVFRPFLYNPMSKELKLISLVNVQITYETIPEIRTLSNGGHYDYVIITTNDIVANSQRLNNFVHLKELYGHTVKVVTEDDFDWMTGQWPNGRAEKIREWLRYYYVGYGIDYVLLIGNPDGDDPTDPGDSVGDIPMKHCYTWYFDWHYRDCLTDWFYADLNGNWDLDGDGIFGELLDVNHPISPDWPNIGTDYFSVRWTGFVHCDFNEEYVFRTFSDGGVRVYLDGNPTPVIDNWAPLNEHPLTLDSVTLNMTAGYHAIKVEYKEHTHDAIIRLIWETTVSKGDPHYVPSQVIPLNHLKNETGVSDGLTGRYWNNIWLSGDPDLVHPNGEIADGIWATGDLGPGGAETGADVFVGRIPVYNNDYAQLDAILDKIIKYETAQPGDIAWRKSALLPMKPMDSTVTCHELGEKIKNDICIPLSFSYYRIYEEDYGVGPEETPCNYNNVRDAWNNSYGLVAWATHGNVNVACDVYHSVYTPELDDTKPAFTAQASCLTAYPERTDNLAYSLLKNGAVAAVGGTRVTIYGGEWVVYSPDNDRYAPFVFFYVKGLTLDGLPAGIALAEEKKPIAYATQNVLAFMLYGDPECYLLYTIPNSPPLADAGGPYVGDEGDIMFFGAGNSYDPEGDDLEYRWDFENDGTWDTDWSTSHLGYHTWCDDYSGFVRVEVRDQLGFTDEDTATVTIKNVAPAADAGVDQTVDEGDIVSFSGSFSDPGCDTWTYEWDFGDGATDSGSLTPTHAYGDNGVFTVTLTVTDDDGGVGTDTLTVTVYNVPPTITDMYLDQPNKQFILPYVHNLTFVGNFADLGWLDTHSGTWNFGDSIIVAGNVIEENIEPDATGNITGEHVYTTPGNYTVTLTLYDDDGATDTDTMQVTVVDEFGALQDINDYIQSLPDTAFKGKVNQQKQAFGNKIDAVENMLEVNNYQGAIQKLENDVGEKADGSLNGNPNNDWIIDEAAQQDICMKIDDLTAYLYILLTS
jgi:hypothetical protein